MTANVRKTHTSLFPSFSELLGALGIFKTVAQIRMYSISDAEITTVVEKMLESVDQAEKTLKFYLYQLIHSPANKTLSPADVISAFHAISEAWSAIPSSMRYDFVTSHHVETFEESIVKLLEDPAALQAARTELHLSLASMAEDEFR